MLHIAGGIILAILLIIAFWFIGIPLLDATSGAWGTLGDAFKGVLVWGAVIIGGLFLVLLFIGIASSASPKERARARAREDRLKAHENEMRRAAAKKGISDAEFEILLKQLNLAKMELRYAK